MRLTRGRADRSRICRDVIRVRKGPHGWQFLINITDSPKHMLTERLIGFGVYPPEVTPKPKYFVTYLQISLGGGPDILSICKDLIGGTSRDRYAQHMRNSEPGRAVPRSG